MIYAYSGSRHGLKSPERYKFEHALERTTHARAHINPRASPLERAYTCSSARTQTCRNQGFMLWALVDPSKDPIHPNNMPNGLISDRECHLSAHTLSWKLVLWTSCTQNQRYSLRAFGVLNYVTSRVFCSPMTSKVLGHTLLDGKVHGHYRDHRIGLSLILDSIHDRYACICLHSSTLA